MVAVQRRPLTALSLGEIKFKMAEIDEDRFRVCEKKTPNEIVET
jgi:hypothetical protein